MYSRSIPLSKRGFGFVGGILSAGGALHVRNLVLSVFSLLKTAKKLLLTNSAGKSR